MRTAAMEQPPRLRAGDRVAVVAPSGPVDPERLARGCARLRALGLEVTVAEHVLDRRGFLAGHDADRARDLERAWCDPAVRAVVCARGGYGAVRLLDLLDWSRLAGAGPKLLHGSSDVTALHVAFGRRLGVATSFGPMVAGPLADEEPDPASLRSFVDGVLGHAPAGAGGAGDGRAHDAGPWTLAGGRARGVLTGGTLSLLVSLLGTPWAPEPARGRVVLLEDVREQPYRVDRMLTQLIQSGYLDGVAGVALGSWVGCGPPAALGEVLTERLGGLGVPVLAGLAVGHGRPQLTLRLGAPVELDADAGVLRGPGSTVGHG